jgi:hypothetical protein
MENPAESRRHFNKLPASLLSAFVCALTLISGTVLGSLAKTPDTAKRLPEKSSEKSAEKPAQMSVGAGETGRAKSSKGTILNFPKNYSMGALYEAAPNAVPDGERKYFAKAQGNVTVPAGTKLDLIVSYQGGRDLPLLCLLPQDVMVGLIIRGLEVGDKEFESMRCLDALKHLAIEDIDITDRGFMALQKCKNLEDLTVRNCALSGKALAALAGLQNLKNLMLEEAALDNDSLRYLSNLKNLQKLGLRSVKITDGGLVHLAPISSLTFLNLAVNHISDAGVKHLEPLTKLVALDLRSTKVTSACVKSLVPMKNLQSLTITFYDFKPGQIQYIKKGLPHCMVLDGGDTSTPREMFAPLH